MSMMSLSAESDSPRTAAPTEAPTEAVTEYNNDPSRLPLLTTDKGKDFCHSIEGAIPYGRADFLAAEFLSYNLMGGIQSLWTGYSDDSLRTFQRAADYGWKVSYIHIMGGKDETVISRENDNDRILQHVLLDWLSGIYQFGPFIGGCRFWRVEKADQLEIELQLRPPYPTAYPLFQNEGAIDGDYVCASALKGFACERLQRVETSLYAQMMKICQHPLCGWNFPIESMLEETTGVFDMGTRWDRYDLSPHCKLVPVSVEDLEYRQSTLTHDSEVGRVEAPRLKRPTQLTRNNPVKQHGYDERKALANKGRRLSGHVEVEDMGKFNNNSGNDDSPRSVTQTNSSLSRKEMLQKHYQKVHLEQYERIVSILVLDGEVYDMGLQLKPSIGGCSVEDELDLTQNIIPLIRTLSANLRKEMKNYKMSPADTYGQIDAGKRSKFIREISSDKVVLKELTTILNNNLQNNKIYDAASKQLPITNIDLFSRIPNFNLAGSNALTPWLVSNMKFWHNSNTVSFKLNLNDAFFPDYHLGCYKISRHKNIGRYSPYPLPKNSTIMTLALALYTPGLLIAFYLCLNVQQSYWGLVTPLAPAYTFALVGTMQERERGMNFRYPRHYTMMVGVITANIFYFCQYLYPFEVTTKLLRLKTYTDLVEIPNERGNYSNNDNTVSLVTSSSENDSNIVSSNLNDVTVNTNATNVYDFGHQRYEQISVISAPSFLTVPIFINPFMNYMANYWRKKFGQPAHYFDYGEDMNSSLVFSLFFFLGTVFLGIYLQETIPELTVLYVSICFPLVESICVLKLSRDFNRLVYAPNYKLEKFCGGEGLERLPDNTVVVPDGDVSKDINNHTDKKQHKPGPAAVIAGPSNSATVVPIHFNNDSTKTSLDVSDSSFNSSNNDPGIEATDDEALSKVALEQANEIRDKFKSIPSNQFWYLYLIVSIIHQATETAKLILLMYQAYNSPKNDMKVFQTIILSSFINIFNRLGFPRVVGLALLPSDFLKWLCLPTPLLRTHDYVKFSGGWLRFIKIGCLMIIRGITYGDWSILDEKNYKYNEDGTENNQYDPDKRNFTSWCYNGNVLVTFLGCLFAEFVEDILVHHFLQNPKIISIISTVVGRAYFEVTPIFIDASDEVPDESSASNSNSNIQAQGSQNHIINENLNNSDLDAKALDSNYMMDIYSPDLLFCKRKHVPISVTTLDIWNNTNNSQKNDVNAASSRLANEIIAQMPSKNIQKFQNKDLNQQPNIDNNRSQTKSSNSDTITRSDFFGDLLATMLKRLVCLSESGRRWLSDDDIALGRGSDASIDTFGPCPLLVNCRLYCTQRGGPIGFFLTSHSFFGVTMISMTVPGLLFSWDGFLGRNPVFTDETWYRFEQGVVTWSSIEDGPNPTDWGNIWR